MKRVKLKELEGLAEKTGLKIQHDCGGYRVVALGGESNNRYVFPDGGICPTATRSQCDIFLSGVLYQKKTQEQEYKNENP